jgi:2-polyprenyl-6-methoxyphenol hydroxylase-like FAD-dependent oxidoreductase
MKPIIIIGYGPVGALLSLLLAQNQIPVIAIECSTSYPDEPRAVGLFGPSHHVLQDAGVYDEASKQGMPSAGLVYRKRAVDNGCGGQRMGDIIVRAPLSEKMDGQYAPGAYFMLLPQAKLVKIIAQKMQTPKLAQFATVHLGYKYISSEETDAGVTVKAEDDKGSTHVIEGIYLVGADGSHSEVRRQLGLKLHGTSWPDRLISTDVMRTIDEIPEIPSSMVVDPDIWAAITPLEVVYPGKPGLWRYSMAVSDKSVPDEQLRDPQFVDMYLRKHLDGPYGQEYKIIRHKPYRMHQLLCTAMRKGKTFLAGDAAHINNVSHSLFYVLSIH